MKKRNSFYLKEIGLSLILKKSIDSIIGEKFVNELVKIIDMNMVFIKIVALPPGWEIFCCIKQSFIILAYYPEYNFLRININSCKDYDITKVINFVKKYFKPQKFSIDINKNRTIQKEIKAIYYGAGDLITDLGTEN